MTMIPLSVFMIAKDEEARIGAAIDAVRRWADEVVVVIDQRSSDATQEIAESMGASIYRQEWFGYGPQKRYAEQLCRNLWVLNIDCDEVVTPELAGEIQWLFRHGTPHPGAYRTRILTVYPGDARPRCCANDYNVVRLYHRSVAAYRNHPVYDRVEVREGITIGQLEKPIWHHAHINIDHAIEKAMRFSAFRAAESKPRSRAVLFARLAIEGPLTFLKFYLGRRHITGGWKGFYFSAVHAFMRLTRIARMIDETRR